MHPHSCTAFLRLASRAIPTGLVALLLTAAFLTAAFLTSAAVAAEDAPSPFRRAWIDDPSWFDGKAEVDVYDATLVKYGQPRQADELVHIFVTEDHDPELLVKADDWRRPGLLPMLKMNLVLSVRTGVYRYEQMLSIFFDRRDLHVAKMTLSSHEWCGNTFKELVNLGELRSFRFDTYWDGQGFGSYPADFPPDLVLYDSLPGQLRSLAFAPGLTARFPLLPTQLSSKAQRPAWSEATVRVLGREALEVPAGTFDAWNLELRHAGGVDTLSFEAAFPHRMLLWRRADGDTFALRRSERVAYWALNGVGDESRLRD